MITKILLLPILLLFSLTTFSQTYEWAKQMGGTGDEAGNSIAIDASGNLYMTGYFEGTCDFNPDSASLNLSSAGGTDIFVQKMDASGNLIWAHRIGGIGDDSGLSILVDASGNAYITGYFRENVDFDPGAGTTSIASVGDDDIFILKLDASGNFVWARGIGGTDADVGRCVVEDGSGNIYITGDFHGTVDFNPGASPANLTSDGTSDIFVLQLSASGVFSWASRMGGVYGNYGRSIAVDGIGGLYVTGSENVWNSRILIYKLELSGKFTWLKLIEGDATKGVKFIIADQSGVYLTGSFKDNADFDPGAGTKNLFSKTIIDIFILKLSPAGDFLWVQQIGGGGNDWLNSGNSMALDSYGNVYTTGHFVCYGAFNPAGGGSLSSEGGTDIFIQKLDASGKYQWAKSIGNVDDDRGHSIAVDPSGSVYTVGYFSDTVEFNTGPGQDYLASKGGADIFIQKLSQWAVGIDENSFAGEFIIYPNPTKGNFSIDLGIVYPNVEITLSNIIGQTIAKSTHKQEQLMDLNIEAPPGIYFAKIISGNKQAVVKFIKI